MATQQQHVKWFRDVPLCCVARGWLPRGQQCSCVCSSVRTPTTDRRVPLNPSRANRSRRDDRAERAEMRASVVSDRGSMQQVGSQAVAGDGCHVQPETNAAKENLCFLAAQTRRIRHSSETLIATRERDSSLAT